MKELVFVLPDQKGGVASVVYNILKFHNEKCLTKVLLLQAVELNKCQNNINYTFPCDEQVTILYKQSESVYTVYNRIAKYLNKNSVLISNDGNLELGAVYYKRISIPVIYILHGDMDYYFKIMKKYEAVIDCVICVSSYLKNKLDQTNYMFNNKFIPFPLPSIPKFKKIYYNSPLRIGYIGALGEHKGVNLFPKYINKLKELGVDYSFDIIGNGSEEVFLRKAFSINCNVKIHGYLSQNDTFSLLRDMHVLLLFSKGEGLPVCVVEAMKHGAIPIVFDIPSGIPDIINSGKNGYIVPQGGIYEAAIITKKLFERRDLLQQLGKNAQEKTEVMFDSKIQANKYIDTFISTSTKRKDYRICLKELISIFLPSRLRYGISNISMNILKKL